jgi:transitional endoplasmic reticulum ATPase
MLAGQPATECRLLSHGVRRITALLPDGETGTAAFVKAGFVQRGGIAQFDKQETMSPQSAALLARLGGAVPPAGQWQQIAGGNDAGEDP